MALEEGWAVSGTDLRAPNKLHIYDQPIFDKISGQFNRKGLAFSPGDAGTAECPCAKAAKRLLVHMQFLLGVMKVF